MIYIVEYRNPYFLHVLSSMCILTQYASARLCQTAEHISVALGQMAVSKSGSYILRMLWSILERECVSTSVENRCSDEAQCV